jgi:hypothetical protein
LVDYVVGYGEHARWDIEAEHLGDPQIDDELGPRGLYNRQVSCLFAFEYSPNVNPALTKIFALVGA